MLNTTNNIPDTETTSGRMEAHLVGSFTPSLIKTTQSALGPQWMGSAHVLTPNLKECMGGGGGVMSCTPCVDPGCLPKPVFSMHLPSRHLAQSRHAYLIKKPGAQNGVPPYPAYTQRMGWGGLVSMVGFPAPLLWIALGKPQGSPVSSPRRWSRHPIPRHPRPHHHSRHQCGRGCGRDAGRHGHGGCRTTWSSGPLRLGGLWGRGLPGGRSNDPSLLCPPTIMAIVDLWPSNTYVQATLGVGSVSS